MNPWEILLYLIGWTILAFAAVVAFLFIWMLIAGGLRSVKVFLRRSVVFKGHRRD